MIAIPNSFYKELTLAQFQRRLHRFAAEVELNGQQEVVHIPNSGRLSELLFPGNRVGLHFEGHAQRKTRYTLVAAQTAAGWSFIDSRLPNRILARHWQDLPPLKAFTEAHPETTFGASRFDLGLRTQDPSQWALLEAKCVTLVKDGTGLFPDAPTERGRKHLQELIHAVERGQRAFVIYFLQHPEGVRVMANRETDPQFAELMAQAQGNGVESFAYRVNPEKSTVQLTSVPVVIPHEE